MNSTFFVVFFLDRYDIRSSGYKDTEFLSSPSLLISLVKHDDFNKLFTILEKGRSMKKMFLRWDLVARFVQRLKNSTLF